MAQTKLDGFQHRLVSTTDVQIHTVSGGIGPPLVLIHGFPQTWWEWRKVMPLLAQQHHVVAVDLRGAGFSDCPAAGYDKASLANDIHNTMTALGHSRYAVCGHDIGAMVAMAVASLHRDSVTQLIILDAPLPGWSGWEASLASLWQFSFHQKRDLPEFLIYGREYEYVASFIAERTYDHGSFDPEDIMIFAKALALPGRTRAAMEWYRAFPVDHQNALAWKQNPITVPVLALGGEKRFGPRIVQMAKEFALDVQGGSLANASHYLIDERPQEIAQAVLEFLGSDGDSCQ